MSLKSMLFNLGVLVFSLNAGCTDPELEKPQVKETVKEEKQGFTQITQSEPFEQKKQEGPPDINALYVNTTLAHYCMDRSKEQGITDLRVLTEAGYEEEVWFYAKFKLKDKKFKEFWHEAGYEETSEQAKVNLNVVDNVVKKNLKEIIFYHYHPNTFEVITPMRVYKEKDEKGNYSLRFEKQKSIIMNMSLTFSINDMFACGGFMEYLRKNHPEHLLKADCRIVTVKGEYVVKLDPEILTNYNAYNKFIKDVREAYGPLHMSYDGLSDAYDFSLDNKGNYVKEIKKFVDSFKSSEYIDMSFEEF